TPWPTTPNIARIDFFMSSPCLVKTVKTTLMTNRDQDGCSNSIQIQGTIIGFAEKKPICSLGDEIQLRDQHLVVERVRPAWCTAIERRRCTSKPRFRLPRDPALRGPVVTADAGSLAYREFG